MPRLESIKRLLRRWFTSIPFFVLLGLILGFALAIPVIPRPKIAIVPISGLIMGRDYTDSILDALRSAKEDSDIRAVVLQVDSPGGYVVTTEAIYLEVLRVRQQKPVVASAGTLAASGGYYVAIAANFIYAAPTSQIGSVGAWTSLPSPERLDEDTLTSGLFKSTGGSRAKAIAELEMVRQEFVSAVMSQRGERLKLSAEELSQAVVYLGVEALRYGLIDDIGTTTAAVEKAASLAGIRNYQVERLRVSPSIFSIFFGSSDLAKLKSETGLLPVYYYLYFESK